jgi:hypothetical protein
MGFTNYGIHQQNLDPQGRIRRVRFAGHLPQISMRKCLGFGAAVGCDDLALAD